MRAAAEGIGRTVTALADITRGQAVDALWRAGDLSYHLHDDQLAVREQIVAMRAKGHRLGVVLCSRRWGKSLLACTLSIEQCLQQPGSQVRYAAPTQKMVRTIVSPHLRALTHDAPADMRPVERSQEGIWYLGDSQVHIAGTDAGGADRLRGVSTDLGPIDEAGFVDDLDYLIDGVLIPQTATTGGFLLLISSPSVTPAHALAARCARAAASGTLIRRTIYDAPHIDEATREELCEIAGGPQSTTWRREYLCEFVADESSAVLPEFPRVEAAILEERERPPHFVPLIVADVGYHDLTFVLLGYHDFKAGLDVIEAEYVTSKTVARDIDAATGRLAADLWGDAKAAEARRYADAPAMVLAEMPGWRGIAKTQTDGSWKAAVINDVRTRLGQRTIRIHPRCEKLAAHCRYAVWRTPGRDLARVDGYGHFDGVDALAYFTRLLDRATNPYPRWDASVSPRTHWLPGEQGDDMGNLSRLAAGARRR